MSDSPGGREVAHRMFATEYDDASLEYAESDEERAPNYVVTPTGARVNRLFVVGVLTSVEQVNEDTVRARIADPTGAFVVYAGQYQPDELAALQSMEAPAFVAVTGKANTFQPDGSDRVLTSLRPESVTEVDAETRDRWVVTAAEHTLGRIEVAADALAREERGDELVALLRGEGVEPGLAEGVSRAIDHYATTADYLGALRELALQALEVVAGDRSEASSLDVEPDAETGEYAVGDLVDSAPDAARAVTEVAGDVEDVAIDDVAGDDAAAGADDELEADEEVAVADDAVESDATDVGDSETTASADDTSTATETTTDSASSGAADATADEPATSEADASSDSDAASETAATDTGSATTDTESATADTASATADTSSAATDTEAATGTDSATTDAESAPPDEAAAETGGEDDVAAEDVPDEVVDEEERERIEEEYGVGFESGTEVEDPGEADIDAQPEAGEDAAAATEDAQPADDTTTASDAEADDEPAAEPDDEPAADAAEEDAGDEGAGTEDSADEAATADDAAEDVDLEDALLEQMSALDEDGGAEREELVAAVSDQTGAGEDAVQDAIEDALMSGKCYEPSEGTYKPI